MWKLAGSYSVTDAHCPGGRRRGNRTATAGSGAAAAIGNDAGHIWDKKELLHTVLEEVIIIAPRGEYRVHLTLRWCGGLFTEAEVDRPRKRQPTIRADDDTIDLVRRLAQFHLDAAIVGILNRQGKTTAYGHRFNKTRVQSLRNHWNIPRFDPTTRTADTELVTIKRAAEILDVAPSTVHRW